MGFDDYLSKPILQAEDLRKAVRRNLGAVRSPADRT
jgi:CheY-like chemotaxis protein